MEDQAKLAEESGFIAVAAHIRANISVARKLAVAYEHFKYIAQEHVDEYAKKLAAKTRRPATEGDARRLSQPHLYNRASVIEDRLLLQSLDKYAALPPAAAMEAVKAAKAMGCFDGFEVASVEPVASEVKLPDPIVFGRIVGCTDRFFICEWGDDVKLADIPPKHEG